MTDNSESEILSSSFAAVNKYDNWMNRYKWDRIYHASIHYCAV